MCAKSDLSEIWYMRWRPDLRACRNMRSEHVSELQHVRRVHLMRGIGHVQQRSHMPRQHHLRECHNLFSGCVDLLWLEHVQCRADLRTISDM